MLHRLLDYLRFRFGPRRVTFRPRWPMATRNDPPAPYCVVKRGEFLFIEPRGPR